MLPREASTAAVAVDPVRRQPRFADATAESPDTIHVRRVLVPLFFTSGVAALIYQVCWQRLLYVAFGTDIDSVTIIVSTFMLGLGGGALLGGELADRHPRHALAMFSAAELLIGMFGLASKALIAAIGAAAIQGSVAEVAAANFLLLLFPTTLMGSTLPILVGYVMRSYRSIGASIGLLYFVNTLGAALGAAATGFFVFHYLGIAATIALAATLNFAVSASVWILRRPR